MKKDILIYGSGNIGVRHTESLLFVKTIKNIYLYDDNLKLLSNAKIFFKNHKNKNKNKLIFTSSNKI